MSNTTKDAAARGCSVGEEACVAESEMGEFARVIAERAAEALAAWALGVCAGSGRAARLRRPYRRGKPAAKGYRRGPYAAGAVNGGAMG